MDYTQERVATLHDFGGADPAAAVDRAAVVVPMTDREYGGLAAEGVLSELERVNPARVVVPLRAPRERVAAFVDWVTGFDLPVTALWCNGPTVTDTLGAAGLDGEAGKGRDVWLGLGLALATEADYVVTHDADGTTYTASHVRKLCYPLDHGLDFSKGYYARVENERLYGRLFRLLYAPLVRTLADANDAPVLDFLGAFRYALAGESAVRADLAASMRVERRWGLEVGVLGEAFRLAGAAGSAQVDLGRHEHDHRAVSGPAGLSDMSAGVAHALLCVVEEHGVDPAYESLAARYRETARRLVRGHELDAGFNGLAYDRDGELGQVDQYADAVVPPGGDTRLPAWADAPVDVTGVRDAAAADLDAVGVDPGVVEGEG